MTPNDRPPHDPELREQVTRLRRFLRRAVRFWPTLLGALVLGGVAFGVLTWLRQPHYRSETVILYVERRGPDETAGGEAAKQAVTVRLRELLFARPNLERVIKKYDLYPEVRRRYGMVDAVEELKKHMDFKAPGGDTFSIAFEGTSPSQAQQVTQELSRLVIEGDSELRKSQARAALEFLTGERKLRDGELRAAEEQLAAFMAKHPRFALDATPLANGAAIRATMAEPTAAPATPGAPRQWPPPIRAGVGAAKNGTTLVTPPAAPAVNTNAAEEARARAALAAASENLAEKSARYTAAHPDVRAAEAAVQRAQERLAALAAAAPPPAPAPKPEPVAEPPAPAAPPAPVRAAPQGGPARVAATPAAPARTAGGDNQSLVDLETEWLRLTRAVTEARQRQDQIESQLFRADIQVSSASGGHGAQVDVIDPAFLPQRPQPPGRTTLAALFLVGSLLIGALATLLRAFLDERVFIADELAEVSDVLVEIPRVTKRRAHAAT